MGALAGLYRSVHVLALMNCVVPSVVWPYPSWTWPNAWTNLTAIPGDRTCKAPTAQLTATEEEEETAVPAEITTALMHIAWREGTMYAYVRFYPLCDLRKKIHTTRSMPSREAKVPMPNRRAVGYKNFRVCRYLLPHRRTRLAPICKIDKKIELRRRCPPRQSVGIVSCQGPAKIEDGCLT